MRATASRHDLLLPGEQPPLTHLGATLLRHAVDSGLRYAFHNLVLPPPEPVPICVERLRLGLCPRRTLDVPSGGPVLTAVAAALEEPDGAARPPAALRGALLFHRARLRLAPRRLARRGEGGPILAILRRHLPALRDALLAELVASLDRRRRRALGRELGPVQSRESARWLAGRDADLSRLGSPDPYAPDWRTLPPPVAAGRPGEEAPRPQPAGAAEGTGRIAAVLRVDPLRGRFRETWRATASDLHPRLHELGADARRRGVVAHPEDPFFLPLQVLDDLSDTRAPDWLPAAVLANRAEYFGLVRAADSATLRAWTLSPLTPLL